MPTAGLAGALSRVDAAGEALFGRVRGRREVDAAAAAVSNVADYGFVWVMVAAAKARRPGPRRRRAVLGLAGAGIASYTVNRLVKRSVNRRRPDAAPASALVRQPTSSSFPSGHTLAAWCTAVSLTDGPAETAIALAFAGAVAASRVQLRAHHLSDVLGGAAIGTAVGLAVRATLHRLSPRE